MARVDLQCGCGYMFFVGDNQLKTPGGVKCPACLHPVKVPAGAAPAAKPAGAKAPPRAAAPTEAPESDPDDALDSPAEASVAPSKTKLYVIGGVVGAVVLGAIVTLVIVMMSPSVDYEKQAQLAEEARK